MKKIYATLVLTSAVMLSSCGASNADQSAESDAKVFNLNNKNRVGEVIQVKCEPTTYNSRYGKLSEIKGQLELTHQFGRNVYEVKGTLYVQLTSLYGSKEFSKEIEVVGIYQKIRNLLPFVEDFEYVDIAEKNLEGTDIKNIKLDFEKEHTSWVLLKNDPVFWTANCKI